MVVSVRTRDGPGSRSEGKGPDGRQAITQLSIPEIQQYWYSAAVAVLPFSVFSKSHIVFNTILIIFLSLYQCYHKFKIYCSKYNIEDIEFVQKWKLYFVARYRRFADYVIIHTDDISVCNKKIGLSDDLRDIFVLFMEMYVGM